MTIRKFMLLAVCTLITSCSVDYDSVERVNKMVLVCQPYGGVETFEVVSIFGLVPELSNRVLCMNGYIIPLE